LEKLKVRDIKSASSIKRHVTGLEIVFLAMKNIIKKKFKKISVIIL
jgi:hypothetical protein